MKVEQRYHAPGEGWVPATAAPWAAQARLVLVFGTIEQVAEAERYTEIRAVYPEAEIILCSTSGEILDTEVSDDRLILTAVALDATQVRSTEININEVSGSYEAGQVLTDRLAGEQLAHVFVISDGQYVNGTELARGFNAHLPPGTLLTGGLAGDGARFERTLVGLNGPPQEGTIAAIGFYGERLRVGFGSSGGWAPFGPLRRVTRSESNVLYELDGQPALALYKTYLGDMARELPGAALRFPLCIYTGNGERTLVRTILSIDEDAGSMVFAGDIPENSRVRFMRASYEDLVDGAMMAAQHSVGAVPAEQAELAICVSCVGRKIVLGQRTEEETEAVRDIIGQRPVITGFYSNGELAPPEAADWCELHNQTMTITLMTEDV